MGDKEVTAKRHLSPVPEGQLLKVVRGDSSFVFSHDDPDQETVRGLLYNPNSSDGPKRNCVDIPLGAIVLCMGAVEGPYPYWIEVEGEPPRDDAPGAVSYQRSTEALVMWEGKLVSLPWNAKILELLDEQ